MITPVDILGVNGSIAKRLENYELRKEQLAMSEAVNRAFIKKQHLLVEAGTGVGKSFAYLIPAILQTAGNQKDDSSTNKSSANNVTINNPPIKSVVPSNKSSTDCNVKYDIPFDINYSPDSFDLPDLSDPIDNEVSYQFDRQVSKTDFPRVIISTHTISLQEQIMEKDIPFLRSVLPFEFTAVLVKGRSNYVCLRRFYAVSQKLNTLWDDFQQREFEHLHDWIKKTEDGSKSSLIPEPAWEIWAEICCETGNCTGKICKWNDKCFYNKTRRRIVNAQILIVNHALFFSDLMLRMQSGGILPTYNMLVFDEAHTIEQVASEHIGISVTQYQVEYNLNRLYNEHTQKGLLMNSNFSNKNNNNEIDTIGEKKKKNEYNYTTEFEELRKIVIDCLTRSDIFFGDLIDWIKQHSGGNGRVRKAGSFRNNLSEGLSKLTEHLRRIIEKLPDAGERQEFRSARDKIISIRDSIDLWVNQQIPDESVYWIEVKTTSRGKLRVSINASPIDIGPILREHLFGKIQSIVMTSATLTT